MGELPDNLSFMLKNTMSLMKYETDPPLPRSDKTQNCSPLRRKHIIDCSGTGYAVEIQ